MVYRVNLDKQAGPEEVAAVASAFHEVGVDVDVQAVIEGKGGLGPSPEWVAYVLVPIGTFMSVMAAAAAKRLGEKGVDAASAEMASLLQSLKAARKGRPGLMVVMDRGESHCEVLLSSDLPHEALEALFSVEPEEYNRRSLSWDARRKRWRDRTGRYRE